MTYNGKSNLATLSQDFEFQDLRMRWSRDSFQNKAYMQNSSLTKISFKAYQQLPFSSVSLVIYCDRLVCLYYTWQRCTVIHKVWHYLRAWLWTRYPKGHFLSSKHRIQWTMSQCFLDKFTIPSTVVGSCRTPACSVSCSRLLLISPCL